MKTKIKSSVNRRKPQSKNKLKPLISVITVCRNAERTIARTIESVLHQTYAHIEYIIIDGVSTDRTLDIVKQLQPQFHGRMYVISEHDNGMYDAMNKGIARVKGELIGILNADDWYELDTVETISRAFRVHGDAVFYGILRYWSEGKEKMLRSVHHQFLPQDTIPHPTCFIARTYYSTYGIFSADYRYAADYEYLLRLYASGKVQFIQIPKILANFSDGGTTTRYIEQTLMETYAIQHRYGYMETKIWLVKIVKKYLAVILRRMKLINE